MLAGDPTETAAQSESCETCFRNVAGRRSEAELLGGPIEFAEHDPRLGTRHAPGGINLDGLHPGEIDHHAVVAHSVARDVVPAAPDGETNSGLSSETQRLDHIALMRAASDQRGPPVDHPIPHRPRFVVPRVTWPDQLSAENAVERLHRHLVEQASPSVGSLAP